MKMPEAVEVYSVADYLNRKWSGKSIIGILYDNKSKFAKPKHKIQNLNIANLPAKVVRVVSRGKLIIIEVINSQNITLYFASHLGMEGKWTQQYSKHCNMWLNFGHLNEDKTAYDVTETFFYEDSRHFGNFYIHRTTDEFTKKFGPCLLSTALVNRGLIDVSNLQPYQEIITLDQFKDIINDPRTKKKTIRDLLMEQKKMSGVGNYIFSETMYKATMDPMKVLGDFTDDLTEILYEAIMEQMVLSFYNKGLSVRTYITPEGHKGTCPLQVYNRKTDPYGNKVEKFKDKKGRMVHWVPDVQTL